MTTLSNMIEAIHLDPAHGLYLLPQGSARLLAQTPTLVPLPLSDATRRALLSRYPRDWRVALVKDKEATWGPLAEAVGEGEDGFLYLPPLPWMQDLREFHTLAGIVAHLRGPDGCPWDRAQSHQSIARYLLEETYEALEALDEGSLPKLREELGDILLQVLLQSQIANDQAEFTLEEVVEGLASKLVRRHPHVFGDATARTAAEVAARWEVIKAHERGEGASLMDGVPQALPAITFAQRVQERAAGTGFDWENVGGVLAKVREELDELAAAPPKEREAELGDVLFSLVNLGRHGDLDVEAALRAANRRFVERFRHMEALCRERGLSFADLPLAEKDRLWEEAKAALRASQR